VPKLMFSYSFSFTSRNYLYGRIHLQDYCSCVVLLSVAEQNTFCLLNCQLQYRSSCPTSFITQYDILHPFNHQQQLTFFLALSPSTVTSGISSSFFPFQ